MKGVLLALSTVIVWAILNVVNRFCVLQYDVNIMVFTSFMIFATGVTLMIIRSIVVEETTIWNPDTSVRQKCGISGYTMFYGGLSLIVFFFAIALLKFFLGDRLPPFLSFLTLLPDLPEMIHPETIISACLAGLFINASTTYLYYATLKFSTSETFMAVRAFQPVLTYLLEVITALYYAAMRPQLDTQDYIYGGIIILGSLLILIIPSKGSYTHQSKDFITD